MKLSWVIENTYICVELANKAREIAVLEVLREENGGEI